MKWFKHETDAHLNMKLQAVINEFGLAGYGFYWLLLEVIGRQNSDEFLVSYSTVVQQYLNNVARKRISGTTKLLEFFAKLNLVDPAEFEKGNIYAPKMKERSDDYTNRVRRKSEQSTTLELELEEEEERGARAPAGRGVQGGRGSRASLSQPAFKKIETGNGELESVIGLVAKQNKWPRQFVAEQAQKFLQQNPEWQKTNKAPLSERLRGWIQKAFDGGWIWRCAWGNLHDGKSENGCACEVEVERQRAEREEKMREAWSKCTRGCDQGRISRKNERGYDEIYPCECVIDFFPAAKAEAAKVK